MFKKKKKEIPPGTFIPTPARVIAIIQLCLAFTVVMWSAGYPFMGELFAVKSKLLLYDNVIGNAERFAQLPAEQQTQLIQSREELQKRTEVPFMSKLAQSLRIMAVQIPPFELTWIFFSIVIALMLLMKIEGALHAVWLLPLIASVYAIDNHLYGVVPAMSDEAKLFPTEEVLVRDYVKGDFSANIFEQQQQLMRAWETYLVAEWAHEQPAEEAVVFSGQVEKGNYAFTVARIQKLPQDRRQQDAAYFRMKQPFSILALYIVWNLFFAWYINKKYMPAQSIV